MATAGLNEAVDDLRAAVAACRNHPRLPLLTLAYACVTAIGAVRHPLASAVGLVSLYFVGWLGVERLWFQRAFLGQTLSRAELKRGLAVYRGRFLRLGVRVVFAASPVAALLAWAVARHRLAAADAGPPPVELPWTFAAVIIALSLAADVVLTFMTQALVFTTAGSGEAVRIGLRVLRDTWPRCAPYALVPPLALVLFGRITGGFGVVGAVSVIGVTMVSLVAKGATARFYLRVMPDLVADGLAASGDGSARFAAGRVVAFDCRMCDPNQRIGRHDQCPGTATRPASDEGAIPVEAPCLCALEAHRVHVEESASRSLGCLSSMLIPAVALLVVGAAVRPTAPAVVVAAVFAAMLAASRRGDRRRR